MSESATRFDRSIRTMVEIMLELERRAREVLQGAGYDMHLLERSRAREEGVYPPSGLNTTRATWGDNIMLWRALSDRMAFYARYTEHDEIRHELGLQEFSHVEFLAQAVLDTYVMGGLLTPRSLTSE